MHPERLPLLDRIAYDEEYAGVALEHDEGDRMCRASSATAAPVPAQPRHHRHRPTVAQAFNDLYYLERAALVQVLATSGGHKLRRVPEEVQRRTAQQHVQELPGLSERLFGAYRRMLDREEPDYRS